MILPSAVDLSNVALYFWAKNGSVKIGSQSVNRQLRFVDFSKNVDVLICEASFLDKLNEFFEIDVVELDIRKDKERKRRIGFYLEEGVEDNVRG